MYVFSAGINRAAFGFRRFGDIRFREIYYTIYSFPKRTTGIKLIIYNKEGLKLLEIGDDVQKGILGNVTFELLEIGCGAFSFDLLQQPAIEILYTHRVDIHLFGDKDPWFSGEILRRPKTGSTKRPYRYGGFGYFNQLETCRVNQAYNSTTFPNDADREAAAIMDHIVRTFIEPNTDVVYNVFKITTAGFTITDINFDRTPAKDAAEKLAGLAQNYQYGVDEKRELFFRPVDTAIDANAIRFVTKNVKSFEYKEPDVSKIRNDLDILAGQITSGSNYITNVSDANSQSAYGKRWGKLTIPEALTISDAERWANYQLSKLKDPKESAVAKEVELLNQARIEAKGKARIFDKDGNKYELAIKKVIYKVSAKGITMDWHLGEIDMPLEEEFVEMMRNLKMQELLQASNISQLAP